MTEINVTIGADKSFTVDKFVSMAGENKAVQLNFTVPESLRNYSKYVEYKLNSKTPVVSAEILPGGTTFSVFLLREVLEKGSLLVQVVCKQGDEVWKSYTRLILINESINASELVIDTGKDILKDLSDRFDALYQLVGAANDVLEGI